MSYVSDMAYTVVASCPHSRIGVDRPCEAGCDPPQLLASDIADTNDDWLGIA